MLLKMGMQKEGPKDGRRCFYLKLHELSNEKCLYVLTRYANMNLKAKSITVMVVLKVRIMLVDPKYFQELLSSKGFTPSSIIRAAGLPESYAAKIENGKISPSPKEAGKICEILNTPFDNIFYVNHGILNGTKMGDFSFY
ncbi:MAG: helix-turn-helix protein [Pelotomaculum sp. PtaB.Bin104]|nr:MAG: helix-turn-helix protein [Pelotomaculum sp. PtaB.Bin104]OPY63117.1 MAG: helix-turn-helix protein [Pelotomaculum sp. PtaU1.Bin065]